MAEWSIAAVLKTVDLHGSGGSNPSLSATDSRVQVTSDLHPASVSIRIAIECAISPSRNGEMMEADES